MHCCHLLTLIKISLFKKSFVDTIRLSNGLNPDQNRSGLKLFANGISRRQKSLLARKELTLIMIKIHIATNQFYQEYDHVLLS